MINNHYIFIRNAGNIKINNLYGLIGNTRGKFMSKIKCLNSLNVGPNIFKWSDCMDNITCDLEKIDRNIHKACMEDDAIKLSRSILLKANFRDKNIYSKSPLDLFKVGQKEGAFKLADLFFSEDRYLWYLLFIWYLKINRRENEAKEVIDRMTQKKLVSHNGWIGDAVNIIYRKIISISPEKLTKTYFTNFCGLNSYSAHEFSNIFLKAGLYEQAIEAANHLMETALKDEELYKELLDMYPNTEFTLENVKRNTEKILSEAFLEITSEVVKECLVKGEAERAEKLIEKISLDWAKIDSLLKIVSYYNLMSEFDKAEAILRRASELVIFIKDIEKRKKYIYLITDKWSKDKVININGDEVSIDSKEYKGELDSFINSFSDYISKRKSDEYTERINKFIKEGNIQEAEKVLDILPYDYDNWDIVRLIQENYILVGDFYSAISVNEKYQYKISRLHGIIFILDKVIKSGIDEELALDIIDKNILESYKACTRWNKCEEIFRIAYTQGANGYIKEAKNSAELGMRLLEGIQQGKGEFLKLAVRALAAAEEYTKAFKLIESSENEDVKSYSYIELVKVFTWKKDYLKACEVVDKIQSKEHRAVALAEKALVQLKLKDEINGIKSLNSCYKLLLDCKLNTSHYLKKVLCEIEGIRGNVDKSIKMIKEIVFMKDEAIKSIIGYIDNEERLHDLLKVSNNIDIKFDGYSYVNAHLMIANSFKKLGNLELHNKIKSDISILAQIEGENIWKDRITSYIAKAELFSGDTNSFLKLAREFSVSFKGELYNIVNIFKIVKDKSTFKQFVSSVDFTLKEAYFICEIIALLYPESSKRIAELIYEI